MSAPETENPLLLMYRDGGNIVCAIHPAKEDCYQGYGLMIADAVRHVANAFHVAEDDVWMWVDRERYHPTTAIKRVV